MFPVDMDLLSISLVGVCEPQLFDDVCQTLKKRISIRAAEVRLVNSEDRS